MWRELRRLLPHESLLYLGDGKNCPYGGRSRAEIEGFAIEAVERLVEEGVKMVVVGCNTATTAAVETLRRRWPDMPIVGLEPAVKPACLPRRRARLRCWQRHIASRAICSSQRQSAGPRMSRS